MAIIPQLIINSLIAGAIYALLALGFNFIYGAGKFFNLAYGASAALGGYGVYFFHYLLGWNLIFSLGLAIIFSGLSGYGFDKLIFYRLRTRKASSLVLIVSSLGIFTAVQAIIAILFSTQFQIINRYAPRVYPIFGGVITRVQLIIFLAVITVAAGLAVLNKKTKFGRAVRAISDDEEASKIIGINTEKIIGRVFFIGSAIAGLAGILAGFDTGIDPNMGLRLLLKGIIASIVGGIGNLYGGILGGLFLGLAENFGIWKISGEWKDAIAFAVLILFLLFRPQGILKK